MRNLCALLVTRNQQWLVLASLLLMSFLAMAQAQSSTARTSQPEKSQSRAAEPQKTVDHASWVPRLASSVGISEQDFRDMGLAALTKGQVLYLLVWASGQQQKAKESVVLQTFDCGRPGQKFEDAKPEEYGKVHVNVSADGTADADCSIALARSSVRSLLDWLDANGSCQRRRAEDS